MMKYHKIGQQIGTNSANVIRQVLEFLFQLDSICSFKSFILMNLQEKKPVFKFSLFFITKFNAL